MNYPAVFAFLVVCCVPCSSQNGAPGREHTLDINLLGQQSDLRRAYAPLAVIKELVRTESCNVDARGRVFDTNGVPFLGRSIRCQGGSPLVGLMQMVAVDITALGGVQIRVFKRDAIYQSPLAVKERTEAGWTQFKSIVIEPGDVIVFTSVE